MLMAFEQLNAIQARVLGSLIEKEITTPDYYPLTLNALVAACNQKSNRHPVVEFDDAIVLRALDELKLKSMVMGVTPLGSRVTKYKHALREKLDLLDDEIALICELLIRGPQTLAELRTRCERMYAFASSDDVLAVLERLAGRNTPLTRELPRLPGQKEARWTHLLCGEPDLPSLAEAATAREPVRIMLEAENARIAALEAELATLKSEIATLKQSFEFLRTQFG